MISYTNWLNYLTSFSFYFFSLDISISFKQANMD